MNPSYEDWAKGQDRECQRDQDNMRRERFSEPPPVTSFLCLNRDCNWEGTINEIDVQSGYAFCPSCGVAITVKGILI